MLLSQIGQPYDPQANTRRGRSQLHLPGRRRGRHRLVRRPDPESLHGLRRQRLLHRRVQLATTSTTRTWASSAAATSRATTRGARPIQSFGPLPPGTPTWGSGWKAAVKQYYNRIVSFGMQGECPAYRQNYADLDPHVSRRLRQPAASASRSTSPTTSARWCSYVAENALTHDHRADEPGDPAASTTRSPTSTPCRTSPRTSTAAR